MRLMTVYCASKAKGFFQGAKQLYARDARKRLEFGGSRAVF